MKYNGNNKSNIAYTNPKTNRSLKTILSNKNINTFRR
jgi:hypothetical protein